MDSDSKCCASYALELVHRQRLARMPSWRSSLLEKGAGSENSLESLSEVAEPRHALRHALPLLQLFSVTAVAKPSTDSLTQTARE